MNKTSFNLQQELIERLNWFVKLRWAAAAGVLFTVFFVNNILRFTLQIVPLYAVAILLCAYNAVFFLLIRYLKKKTFKIINGIANAQISLDLLCLAALVHFSGGVENPFIFYFVFHMIIASILLERRASFMQATVAVLLYSLIVAFEYSGVLQHYCIKNFMLNDQHRNIIYISGISFVFITTIYIAVYMATSVSGKLRERSRLLEDANELLNEKDRVKSEYVLRVSHDIKEHLSAILSCLYPVSRTIIGVLNPEQSDMINRAVNRTERLSKFVKALLEITRMRLVKDIKMEFFALKDVVYEVINYISQKANDKNINIKTKIDDGASDIKGAKDYIRETIFNLLANSIKYTPQNGSIEININDRGNSMLIKIKDTGIGIPKDEMPRLFEEFYRASNAKKTERDGTGLGLSIAKHVVEMHKGKIWVESEEGKGSVFYIELPKDFKTDEG